MEKALCFVFIGLLFAGFLLFFKDETKTATHGHIQEHLGYPETRSAMLRVF